MMCSNHASIDFEQCYAWSKMALLGLSLSSEMHSEFSAMPWEPHGHLQGKNLANSI